MPLHNWVYGGQLVLFTAGAAPAVSMPPSGYLAALAELLRLGLSGEHLARAARQIGGWLAGPSELGAMAPLNLATVIIVIRVAVWRRADPWLRLTAGATLAQHCVGLFFLTYGRYYYLTWLLTLLVVAAWLHAEGLELWQRWFPALTERISRHPASVRLGRALERVSRLVTDGNRAPGRAL
jgi:hypothetical protein